MTARPRTGDRLFVDLHVHADARLPWAFLVEGLQIYANLYHGAAPVGDLVAIPCTHVHECDGSCRDDAGCVDGEETEIVLFRLDLGVGPPSS